jgi:hypothetical protein
MLWDLVVVLRSVTVSSEPQAARRSGIPRLNIAIWTMRMADTL